MASDRAKKAYEARLAGKTYKAIGESLGGISRERARQLIKSWERHLRWRPDGLKAEAERSGVSPRTINAVLQAGLRQKSQIKDVLNSGEKISGISSVGVSELRRWLKMDPAPTKIPSEAAVKSALTTLRRAGFDIP